VKQLAGRVHPGSLEGVARNHGGVSVIYQTTQHSQTTTPYRFFLKILSAKLIWFLLYLQATHLRVLNQDLVCENLFLIFFGLSEPL
jgi:hypothetical protein